ncbi:MAG: PSD1 domain-containing protein [Planctomycetaceae bacterium]|nr:PSD1 domain-containing protein [Planctomycetaceae bacterium]
MSPMSFACDRRPIWCYLLTFATLRIFALANGWGQEPIPSELSWTTEQLAYFESKVRPLLIQHCQSCHGAEETKGGLQLLSREHLLVGGDSGAAIVPGDSGASLLIEAVKYESLQMPPDQKLTSQQVEVLEQWIKMGAPWPGGQNPTVPLRRGAEISAEDRSYWAFQPLTRPPVPQLAQPVQPSHPIDAFIGQKLAEKNLRPNPQATPRELIRRAMFDLIGLPPTPAEVARFEQQWASEMEAHRDRDVPQVYLDLIDDLLKRPEYGERWGRHWLDVVRFAQSNGYERDGEKERIWMYRDYVIEAFNADKPYDRFVLEQLAGDELPDASAASRIATGFYRLGVWDDEADDPRQAEFDDLDDILVTTGASFLGLTLGCCRCHDHKFDPLPQQDYYRLLAFFRNIQRYTDPKPVRTSSTFLPTIEIAQVAELVNQQLARRAELQAKLETALGTEKESLEAALRDESLPIGAADWTNGVREASAAVPPVHVLIRGNAGQEGPVVEPALPLVFGGGTLVSQPIDGPLPSSGRRLALARWIASAENPLTARVMVNRVWYHHFGRGIVPTTTDFGKAGLPPTHPELLDWLATEFLQQGWSVKSLHRLIMTSQAYRRSSRHEFVLSSENAANLAVDANVADPTLVDPANTWLWRANLQRLSAEAIRDSMLAISGRLNSERGGRGFFPQLAGEVLAGGSRPGSGWGVSDERQQDRRSVYMFVKRTMSSPWLDLFDYTNLTQPIAERPHTTVAPQALMLLNDDFMLQQAESLAKRAWLDSAADKATAVERAFELAVQRRPNETESEILRQFLARQTTAALELRNRATFTPNVPLALHAGFLGQLQPQDCLRGPRTGWSYLKGRWEGAYEGIVNQNLDFGPAALWNEVSFTDGTVTTELTMGHSTEFAAVVVGGIPDGDFLNGLEIRLLPASDTLEIASLRGVRTVLGRTTIPLETGLSTPLRISVQANKIAVAVNDLNVTVLEVTDPAARPDAGRVAFRVWGAPLAVDRLQIETATGRVEYEQADDAENAGLVAACLLILNLNEVIYVD